MKIDRKDFSSKFLLTIFIIFHFSDSTSIRAVVNLDVFKSQFTLFANCHVKFVFLKNFTPTYSNYLLETIISQDLPTAIMSNPDNIFSSETFFIYNNTYQVISEMYDADWQFKKPIKLPNCLVHIYIPYRKTFEYIPNVLEDLRKVGEWPSHAIFLETLDNDNASLLEIYREEIPLSFVRGLVLAVDLLRTDIIHLICIPCAWWHGYDENVEMFKVSVDLKNFQSLKHVYTHLSHPLQTNLLHSGVLVDTSSVDLRYCDFTSKSTPFRMITPFTNCIHYILSEKFNYTIQKRKRSASGIFEAAMSSYIDDENVRHIDFIEKIVEWVPFGVVSEHMEFIAFQRKPHFSASALVQPYHWRGWVLIVTMATGLLLITILFAGKSEALTLSVLVSMVTSIIAGMLDQPIYSKCNVSAHVKIYKSHILALIWLLWILIIVVLGNGYKGTLYSFLTTESPPSWPKSLSQLVASKYCVLTTEEKRLYHWGKLRYISSYVRSEFLEPLMHGIPGVDFPDEYSKLNETLRFYIRGETDITSKIIQQNPSLIKDPNCPYKVGKDKCTKFAILQSDPIRDSISLLYLMKELVMSERVVLPRFRTVTPPLISRNFFMEPFLNGVAALESSGILQALQNHMTKWLICLRILSRTKLAQDTSTETKIPFLRCLTQISGKVTNPNELREKYPPQAISIQQIVGAFYICMLVSTGLSLLIFIFELCDMKSLKRAWNSIKYLVLYNGYLFQESTEVQMFSYLS